METAAEESATEGEGVENDHDATVADREVGVDEEEELVEEEEENTTAPTTVMRGRLMPCRRGG